MNPMQRKRRSASDGLASAEEPGGNPWIALGLGANVGAAEEQLCQAIAELERHLGPLQVAPLYRSAPLSPIVQPDFLNTVVLAALPQAPERDLAGHAEELLALAKSLEHTAGRRSGPRDGPRPLDIDILFLGDLRLDRPSLTLPHPRLRQRRFVLAPLADLAPDLPLPPDGAPVAAVLATLGTDQRVERLSWSR